MDALVRADWLSDHLDDPGLVILDCSVNQVFDDSGMRNVSGWAAYENGHIRGADFADLTGDLTSSTPVEFSLPTPQRFCDAMGALGVGDDSAVVLYDTSYNAWAARVWWMLRWVGFDRAAILDGGLNAWREAGGAVSTEPVTRTPKQLTPAPRPDLIADRDEVLAAINDESVTIVDTMPESHYRGTQAMYGRPGHIPGAINISGLSLLEESGCYRSLGDLASTHGRDFDKRHITYCGGGILASSNAFTMLRLGFRDVAVYTASLQEWAADPSNPMVVSEREPGA